MRSPFLSGQRQKPPAYRGAVLRREGNELRLVQRTRVNRVVCRYVGTLNMSVVRVLVIKAQLETEKGSSGKSGVRPGAQSTPGGKMNPWSEWRGGDNPRTPSKFKFAQGLPISKLPLSIARCGHKRYYVQGQGCKCASCLAFKNSCH